jgi:hypothetical protein
LKQGAEQLHLLCCDRVADVEKGDVLGQGRSRKRSGTWGSLLVAGWATINTPAARAGILR